MFLSKRKRKSDERNTGEAASFQHGCSWRPLWLLADPYEDLSELKIRL